MQYRVWLETVDGVRPVGQFREDAAVEAGRQACRQYDAALAGQVDPARFTVYEVEPA